MKEVKKEGESCMDASSSTRMRVIASCSENLEETRKESFPGASSDSVALPTP